MLSLCITGHAAATADGVVTSHVPPHAVVHCQPFCIFQAGAGMAVSEMVIASTLMDGSAASRHLARWHPGEAIRSVQLYGVRPDSIDWACRCGEGLRRKCSL